MTAMVDELRTHMRFAVGYAYVSIRISLAYRIDMLMKLVGYPIKLLMAYFLWNILAVAGMIQDYTIKQVITYYILTYFLAQMFPFVRMAREIRAEIFSGDVLVYMARGVPHWAVWLGRMAATALLYCALVLPAAAVLVALVGHITWTVQSVVGFAGLLLIGIIIKGQLWYLAGISSYYTEENMGTMRFLDVVDKLLSGALLPIFLFPDWLAGVSRYLPFAYTLYMPVEVFLNPPGWGALGISLLVGIAWCAVLGMCIRQVAEGGWRRFTGHGA